MRERYPHFATLSKARAIYVLTTEILINKHSALGGECKKVKRQVLFVVSSILDLSRLRVSCCPRERQFWSLYCL